jgi:UDP-glucuronate 4-epimerase
MRFIELLEQNLGRTVEKRLLPMQPGDVPDTWADVSALRRDVGYAPGTSIEDGVARFAEWYRDYYRTT